MEINHSLVRQMCNVLNYRVVIYLKICNCNITKMINVQLYSAVTLWIINITLLKINLLPIKTSLFNLVYCIYLKYAMYSTVWEELQWGERSEVKLKDKNKNKGQEITKWEVVVHRCFHLLSVLTSVLWFFQIKKKSNHGSIYSVLPIVVFTFIFSYIWSNYTY